MMNRKRIYAGLISAILLAALTGCGANAEQAQPVAPAQTAAETTAVEATNDAPAETAAETTATASTGELEKTTFEIGHLNSTAHLLVFVAKEEGYFEEEGLTANLTLFSSA